MGSSTMTHAYLVAYTHHDEFVVTGIYALEMPALDAAAAESVKQGEAFDALWPDEHDHVRPRDSGRIRVYRIPVNMRLHVHDDRMQRIATYHRGKQEGE